MLKRSLQCTQWVWFPNPWPGLAPGLIRMGPSTRRGHSPGILRPSAVLSIRRGGGGWSPSVRPPPPHPPVHGWVHGSMGQPIHRIQVHTVTATHGHTMGITPMGMSMVGHPPPPTPQGCA